MKVSSIFSKLAVNLCRLVLALTFIFSGYVKAIDPLGTQYKIVDYLKALHLEWIFPDWSTLLASILLSTIEFSLGVLLLFAIRRKLVSKLLLLVMTVMTVVTVWIAVANPVKDCGCFGDAVKLSNMETLVKNIVLLACAVIVWRKPLYMVRFISKSTQWIVINYTIIFSFLLSLWNLWYLPQFDFRPYHIGANIAKGMEIPADAKQPQYETTFILEKDGKQQEFTLDNYPDSTWTFIDSKSVLIEEGYVPPIHDFSIEDRKTGSDLTEEVLADKGYTFLLISPTLENADDSNFGPIDQIYEYAQDHGYNFMCLTSSGDKAIAKWQDITGAEYPFYTTDGTTLKTIIRSNPGLLLIKEGTILQKWSHNDLPTPEQLSAPLEQSPLGKEAPVNTAKKIATIFLWFFFPLLVLTLADRLWAWSNWIRKKENSNR